MTSEVETTTAGIPLYPQTKLQITAQYAAEEGAALPAGMPTSVEIEINDPLPADLLEFVSGLVDSLFRHAPANGSVAVTHNAPAQPLAAGETTAEVQS